MTGFTIMGATRFEETVAWGARHHEPRVVGANVLRSPGRESGWGSVLRPDDQVRVAIILEVGGESDAYPEPCQAAGRRGNDEIGYLIGRRPTEVEISLPDARCYAAVGSRACSPSYSYLRAVIGSTRAARRAGR